MIPYVVRQYHFFERLLRVSVDCFSLHNHQLARVGEAWANMSIRSFRSEDNTNAGGQDAPRPRDMFWEWLSRIEGPDRQVKQLEVEGVGSLSMALASAKSLIADFSN